MHTHTCPPMVKSFAQRKDDKAFFPLGSITLYAQDPDPDLKLNDLDTLQYIYSTVFSNSK